MSLHFCPNCGTRCSDIDRFCTQCGHSLEAHRTEADHKEILPPPSPTFPEIEESKPIAQDDGTAGTPTHPKNKKIFPILVVLVILAAGALLAGGLLGSSGSDPLAMLSPGQTIEEIHAAYGEPDYYDPSYNCDNYDNLKFLGASVDLSVWYDYNGYITHAFYSFSEYGNSMTAQTFSEKAKSYYTRQYGEPVHLEPVTVAGYTFTPVLYSYVWHPDANSVIKLETPDEDDPSADIKWDLYG